MYKFNLKAAKAGVPMMLEDGTPVKYLRQIRRKSQDDGNVLCLIEYCDNDMPIITSEEDDMYDIFMAGIEGYIITREQLESFNAYIKPLLIGWLSAYKDVAVHYDDKYFASFDDMKVKLEELINSLKQSDDEHDDATVSNALETLSQINHSLWW